MIDSDEFISNLTDKNIQEFQQKYNLDNNLKKIVFIGRIAYEKVVVFCLMHLRN